MYGPPLYFTSVEVGEGKVCVKASGLLEQNPVSRALEDDSHAPALTNPSVTQDAFTTPGSDTPFDCSLVVFSAQQAVVECLLTFVVARVEEWKVFFACQVQCFFHGQPEAAECSA